MAARTAYFQESIASRLRRKLLDHMTVFWGLRQHVEQAPQIAAVEGGLGRLGQADVAVVARTGLRIEQFIGGCVVQREAAAAILAVEDRPFVAMVELDVAAF